MLFSSPPTAPQRDIDFYGRAIVAIPAKDEAEHLPACLRALSHQVDDAGRPLPPDAFGVIVFANNCSDDSAVIVNRAALAGPYDIRVVEANLPKAQAHAGGARRAAMDLAEAWLRAAGKWSGVILTTDADSRVSPTWIYANLNAFARGADAVLGQISLDQDGERLPAALHARGKLESVYGGLLTEISARLDPQASNPWPHHATISGASLALRRDVYLRIGRLPRVRLGEDKALVAALRRQDARIRFAPEVSVVTSGRIAGRAVGGVADTLRLRAGDPSALCDDLLEPCGIALRRALWRGRLRREGFAGAERWREALRLPPAVIRRVKTAGTFGAAWRAIELSSPALATRLLAPSDLPGEIVRAERLLRRLQLWAAPGEDVEAVFGSPDLMGDFGGAIETSYEEFDRLVGR
jgi:glycosyltransferase involved in cell wall biosynthesis